MFNKQVSADASAILSENWSHRAVAIQQWQLQVFKKKKENKVTVYSKKQKQGANSYFQNKTCFVSGMISALGDLAFRICCTDR